MDKRKTQRILGILVIIALVIILFPLLFSKNDVTQTANIAAPSFPTQQKAPTTTAINNNIDQPNTVTNDNQSAANENVATPVEPDSNIASIMNKTEPTATSVASPTEVQDPIQAAVTEDTIPATAEENVEVKTVDQANEDAQKAPAKVSSNETIETLPIQKPVKKPHSVKTSKAKKSKEIIHEVASLNKAAWVIQMGSFKNKDNARSLTDKLRAAGYNAFTKEIKSVKGNLRTRVYVGPEFKEAEATKISHKIQRDLNLPNIVLPYKPLAL